MMNEKEIKPLSQTEYLYFKVLMGIKDKDNVNDMAQDFKICKGRVIQIVCDLRKQKCFDNRVQHQGQIYFHLSEKGEQMRAEYERRFFHLCPGIQIVG